MNLLIAFVLGIVQGLTEFIPVSSTAHLLIDQHLAGLPSDDSSFAFNVLIQLGTLAALIVYFRQDLWTLIKAFFLELRNAGHFESLSADARLAWSILIATLPALLAGALLKDLVELLFKAPLIEAAIRLFSAAILLTLAERYGARTRTLEAMTRLDALIVGLFQVLSLFPGASRSGTTISGGMLRGLDRPSAARFAFLMSVPIMLAAGAYETLDVFKLPNLGAFLPGLAVGFVTAAVTGWFAVRWLLGYLKSHSLYAFAGYCVVVGTIALALQFFS